MVSDVTRFRISSALREASEGVTAESVAVFDEPDAPAPEAPPPDLAEAARRYAQLHIDRLFSQSEMTDALKEQETAAQEQFLSACVTNAASGIKVTVDIRIMADGLEKRIPMRHTLTPTLSPYIMFIGGQQAVIEALKKSRKYAGYVTEAVNKTVLLELALNFEEQGKPLPPTLAKVLKIGYRPGISMVRSGKA